MLARIAAAVATGHGGARSYAEELLQDVWQEIAQSGSDPLHVCAAAHALADVQHDVREELRWDMLALEAASSVTDDRLREAGALVTARGLLPSLHLNVADASLRLGDRRGAQLDVRLGTAALGSLPGGAYAQVVGDALARLPVHVRDRGDPATRGRRGPSR